MPVIAQYRFIGKDMGLLALAFPGWRLLRGPIFEPFIPNDKVIVVSEDPRFSKYPEKQIIQIISTAQIAVDSRAGFLSLLAKQGTKATREQVRTLLNFTEEEFWQAAKLAVVLKCFPTVPRDGIDAENHQMIRLYEALFHDFGSVWRNFWELRKARSNVALFCSVCRMIDDAKRPNERSHKAYYRAILEKNREFTSLFLLGLDRYLKTQRNDMDLLALFAMCSAHTRPPGFLPYFKWWHFVGEKLVKLGFRGDPEKLEAAFRHRFPTMF